MYPICILAYPKVPVFFAACPRMVVGREAGDLESSSDGSMEAMGLHVREDGTN